MRQCSGVAATCDCYAATPLHCPICKNTCTDLVDYWVRRRGGSFYLLYIYIYYIYYNIYNIYKY